MKNECSIISRPLLKRTAEILGLSSAARLALDEFDRRNLRGDDDVQCFRIGPKLIVVSSPKQSYSSPPAASSSKRLSGEIVGVGVPGVEKKP